MLQHSATSWKLASSIPDDIHEVFSRAIASGRAILLALSQPLIKMNTRILVGCSVNGA
jgi:hypothetical protein